MEKTTFHTGTFNGIPMNVPNKTPIQTKDFYISYNNYDIAIYGCPTTALVLEKPCVKFLILNGNHTKQYKDIIEKGGTYQDCLQYFVDTIDKKSKYSENFDKRLVFENDNLIEINETDKNLLPK